MSSFQKVTRAAFGAVSKLLELQLRGAGDQGDDDTAEPTDRAGFLQQLGMAVRPIIADPRNSTLWALVDQDGDEPRATKLWDKARTPTDLAAGETRLYAVGAIGNVLKLLTDAAVLEAASIKLGAAATKKVARMGDTVRVTIPSGTNFAMTVPGVGAVTASTTAPVTCDGEITSGSDKIRGED
ncbi:MAG: hypothetical protein ACEQSX_01545 [Baekduiaceae bacterium]